jgi:hypothetical protein
MSLSFRQKTELYIIMTSFILLYFLYFYFCPYLILKYHMLTVHPNRAHLFVYI